MYNVTEQDIQFLGSNIKQYNIRLELLNSNLQTIDILDGVCLGCSYNCDSTSDVRRSCNIKIYIKDKSYTFNEGNKFWFNRFLKIYIGLQTINSNGIKYYPIGLYTYSEGDITWNNSNRTLELKAVDFIWYLIQTKLGGANNTKIPAGNIIRNTLVSVITQLGGIQKYDICDIHNIENKSDNTIPYDISVEAGTSVFDLIKKIRDLYVGYETFMDMDTFVTKQIPNMIDDPIVLDYQTIENKHLVISENLKIDFSSVFNVIEVFGETLDVDYYADNSTNSGSNYSCTIGALTELYDDLKIAVKLNVPNGDSPTLTINNLGTYPIVDSDGSSLQSGAINDFTVFEFKYQKFYLLGKYQVHSVCILRSTEPTNDELQNDLKNYNVESIVYRVIPDSPFTIEKIGIKKDVKSGSNYDNIPSNDLCAQRAQYENWKATRLNYILELQTQIIPFADVEQKFTYQLKSTKEIKTFVTTKISIDDITKGIETIEATQFYPTYPNGASY